MVLDAAPLLFLEVNITKGKQGKLMIFDGDDPEEIVNIFSEVYKIGEAKKRKLLEIVKSQLRNVLQNIGEVEDDEEDGSRQNSEVRKKE